ncbi:MAG: ferric reductase-like transmembrane domain-containing protein [Rhodospirillales bacterium]
MTPSAADMQSGRRRGLPAAAIVLGYLGIVLLPLALALFTGRVGRGFLKDLGHAFGMIAYAMMLAQFMLIGRFEALSGRVGIDVLMRFHQLAARTLVVFILLHPILMAGRVMASDIAQAPAFIAALLLDPKYVSGVGALAMVLTLAVISIWRRNFRIPYEIWRALHGLLALGIAGSGWHHATTVGRFSKTSPLADYWLVLFAIACLTLLYIYFLKPFLQRRRPYRVVKKRRAGEKLWEITLSPDGGHVLDYAAGQFAWINFRRLPVSLLDHPFSLATSPAQGRDLSFIIQEDGDFTRTIGTIEEGHVAYLDAPHGNFTLAGRDGNGIALIAGGVGVAPILGILRDLHAKRDPRPIRLIYGARHENKLACTADIEALKQTLDLKTCYTVMEPSASWSGDTGIIDQEKIRACFDFADPAQTLYFLCGPPRMMESIEACLLGMGVPLKQIVYERFTFD